jgi:hypothetical protein
VFILTGKWMLRFGLLLVVALCVPVLALAQTATVTGIITDPSGAAVVKAHITIHNVGTGIDRILDSSDAGEYSAGELPAGTYSLTVEKDGFKKVTVSDLTLTVDQSLTLNSKLELASGSATIEVAGQTLPTVDLQTATISNVIEEKQMNELPMILRDPYQLALLGPGVVQSDDFGGISVNGTRTRNNNFLLDGVDNNDADVPGQLGGLTTQNPDSTQEFRVITSNFAPEYGRNNGAIIDVVTRSGTNAFHGDGYYYGRWDALGARDFFNHQIDPLTGDVEPKNPYVRNLYGVSVGGPIKKDRTFFFLNYQGDRFVTTLTNESTVPTDAFKTGIFTYTNPVTGATDNVNLTTPGTANNGTSVGLDPVVQKILSFYPTPSVGNGDGVTGTLFFPSQSREKDEDATIKIDHRISKNNNLFVRYIFNWFNDPNPFHSDFLPGDLGAISSPQRTQSFSIGLTSTVGSTFVNEARFGGNRANLVFNCSGVSTFNSLGLIDQVGRGADYGLPFFSGFGCQGLGDTDQQDSRQGTYQTWDNMTKTLGKHTFKWGGEFRDVYSNNFTSFDSRELLDFNNYTDFGITPAVGLSAGQNGYLNEIEDLSSLLLGLVSTQSQTQFFNNNNVRLSNDLLGFRQHEVAIYGQDSWKIMSNLTLTYGLRWEYYGVPYEVHSNLGQLFEDPSSVLGPAGSFTFTPVGPGNPQLFSDYHRNFEPRFGFNWDPFKTGRTAIRGAIGVFSDRIYGNLAEDVRGDPPFQPSLDNFPTADNGTVASAQVSNISVPGNLSLSPIVPNGAGIFPDLFAPNIKPPRVLTWNFGFQREIAHNLTIDANYVGNHGTRILRVLDANPPQPALVSQLLASGVPPSDLQFGLLYFGAEDGVLPFDPVNNNAFEHTFTDQTTAKSFYDGLQMEVTEHAFHGLLIQLAYTYSHALDNASDPLVTNAGNGNYPVNSLNLGPEYGNSPFDARHRASINFVYAIPVGRGTAHMNQGFFGRAVEGWELSGIGQMQTGSPYDIFQPFDTLHTGFADRATIVGSLQNPSGTDITHTGPPLSAFATTPNWGVPSNVARNFFYGPGFDNWDLALQKSTAITERLKFQLRIESYNIANHVHFAKPDNLLADATFGESLSQVGQNDGTTGARQFQIGAKLIF